MQKSISLSRLLSAPTKDCCTHRLHQEPQPRDPNLSSFPSPSGGAWIKTIRMAQVVWNKYKLEEQLEKIKNVEYHTRDIVNDELSGTDEFTDPAVLMRKHRIRSDFGVGAYRGIIPGKPRFNTNQMMVQLMIPIVFIIICALVGLLYLQLPGKTVKGIVNDTVHTNNVTINISLNRAKRQATKLKEKDGVFPYVYVQKNAFQEHMTLVKRKVFGDRGNSEDDMFVCTPDSIEVFSPREIDLQETQCLVRLMLCDIRGRIQLIGFRGIGFMRINISSGNPHITHHVVTDRDELEQRIAQFERLEGKTNYTRRWVGATRKAGYIIYTEPSTRCLDYNNKECQDEAYIALDATILVNGEWGKSQELRCRTGGWNNMTQAEIRETAYLCSVEWRSNVQRYGWLTDKEFSLSIAKIPTFSLCFRGIGEGVHLGDSEGCKTIVTWPGLQAGTAAIADRFWLCGGRAYAQLPPNWSGICSVVALQSNYFIIPKLELKENMLKENMASLIHEDSANIWSEPMSDQLPAVSPTKWYKVDSELLTLENEMSRGISKTLGDENKLVYFSMQQNRYYLDKMRAETMGLALRLGGGRLLCAFVPGKLAWNDTLNNAIRRNIGIILQTVRGPTEIELMNILYGQTRTITFFLIVTPVLATLSLVFCCSWASRHVKKGRPIEVTSSDSEGREVPIRDNYIQMRPRFELPLIPERWERTFSVGNPKDNAVDYDSPNKECRAQMLEQDQSSYMTMRLGLVRGDRDTQPDVDNLVSISESNV